LEMELTPFGNTQGYCPQYAFNQSNNQISNSGYTYDAAGNLLNDNTYTYQYDAEGRVTHSYSTGQWQYPVYNALGQRVEDYQGTASTSLKLYYPRDIFGHRTGIWDDHSSVNWVGWDIYWSQVAGQRLNMGGASAFIDHADALGSTTMETDPAGGVQWDITYFPWGQIWQQTGTRQTGVWAGLDWQVNDPLIPSATREYSDNVNRWMTPDPAGVKVVKLDNPQTWNMYEYALDNPTSLNDPSGLNACSPNDKSQSDCSVDIVIANRTKDKNGNYNDRFTNVTNEKNYNATAKVLVNGKLRGAYLIKTTPSSSKYATLKAGTYTGTRILHDNKYPAIMLTGKGMPSRLSPALGGRDAYTGKPYIKNAEIHMSGYGNITGFTRAGLAISRGCSVVACSQYPSFESVTGLNAPALQMDFSIMIGASANGGDE